MTIAGAARYPQPRDVSIVLAEQQDGFCDHGGVPGRCPSCRAATPPPDIPDSPESAAPRPRRRRAARPSKDDDDLAPGQLW